MHSTGFSVLWPEADLRCGICQTVVWWLRPPFQWPILPTSRCLMATLRTALWVVYRLTAKDRIDVFDALPGVQLRGQVCPET
jgi:hypothetical protein